MAGLFQKARFFYSCGEAFPGACGEVRSLEMLESLPVRAGNGLRKKGKICYN